MACSGSRILASTLLLVFLEFIHAKLKKKIMKTNPDIAHTIVFFTALLLSTSVISSSFSTIFTNLFYAGVHFVKISSTPCCCFPALISSKIEELISFQSDKAVAYSLYSFFETTPVSFIIFN